MLVLTKVSLELSAVNWSCVLNTSDRDSTIPHIASTGIVVATTAVLLTATCSNELNMEDSTQASACGSGVDESKIHDYTLRLHGSNRCWGLVALLEVDQSTYDTQWLNQTHVCTSKL